MPAINLWEGRDLNNDNFASIRTDSKTGMYKIREYKPRTDVPKLREYKPRTYDAKFREYKPKNIAGEPKLRIYDKLREYEHYFDVENKSEEVEEHTEDTRKFYKNNRATGSVRRTVTLIEDRDHKFRYTDKNRPKIDTRLARKGRHSAFS